MLTRELFEKLLTDKVEKVEFREALSCAGRLCPTQPDITPDTKYILLINTGLQSPHQQKISLAHEIAHIYSGIRRLPDGSYESLVEEELVEAEAARFCRENPGLVDRVYSGLFPK